MKNIKSKDILITGGNGYIGSILVPELLSHGHNLTVVDFFPRFASSTLVSCLHHPKLNLVRGDQGDAFLMKELLEKTEVLIPLAGIVGAPKCKNFPGLAHSMNISGLKNLLELASEKDLTVIFPSSNSVYGYNKEKCDENTPPNPLSLYAEHKLEGEEMVKRLFPDNYVILRFATLFGVSPNMRPELLVNDFVRKAILGNAIILYEKNYIRSLLHVRDAAKAFCFSVQNFSTLKGNTYNVGHSDLNLSKDKIAQGIKYYFSNVLIEDFPISGKEIRDMDQRNYYVNSEKIYRKGFRADISLDQGIKEAIKFFSLQYEI